MIVYRTPHNVLDPGDTLAKHNPYDTEISACWKIPAASTISPYRTSARDDEGSWIVGKISVTKTGWKRCEGGKDDPFTAIRLISPDET